MKLQQYQVTLTDPQRGPNGGKRKPIVSTYYVAAHDSAEALAVFRDECESLIAPETKVTVTETLCRVMGGR